ncbi:MAG TPA: quercetin 2,3-dioxygenase [Bryobacteraceae bacterium]|nr:quercetin 2,3-dioxygenase [Bryobacteraceae bacterium]
MGTALLSFDHPSLDSRPASLLRFQGGLFTVHADSKDTGGQFALLEVEGASGGEPPLHVHRNEDELFYVLEGTLKVFRGSEEIELQPGDSGFLPRNVPHTFKIMSRYARFLVYITPGGFEDYFRDLGQPAGRVKTQEIAPLVDAAEMIRVAGRYGVTFMT